MKSRTLWIAGILLVAAALIPAAVFAAEHGGATAAPAAGTAEHGGATAAPSAPKTQQGGTPAAPAAAAAPEPAAAAPAAATPAPAQPNPPAPPALKPIVITFSGELSALDAKATPAMVTVQDRYGVKKEISVPAEAKISQGGAAKAWADLKTGEKLTVEYTYDVATGKRTAQSISIGEAAPAGQ